jgi:hypothetical protein
MFNAFLQYLDGPLSQAKVNVEVLKEFIEREKETRDECFLAEQERRTRY